MLGCCCVVVLWCCCVEGLRCCGFFHSLPQRQRLIGIRPSVRIEIAVHRFAAVVRLPRVGMPAEPAGVAVEGEAGSVGSAYGEVRVVGGDAVEADAQLAAGAHRRAVE